MPLPFLRRPDSRAKAPAVKSDRHASKFFGPARVALAEIESHVKRGDGAVSAARPSGQLRVQDGSMERRARSG